MLYCCVVTAVHTGILRASLRSASGLHKCMCSLGWYGNYIPRGRGIVGRIRFLVVECQQLGVAKCETYMPAQHLRYVSPGL